MAKDEMTRKTCESKGKEILISTVKVKKIQTYYQIDKASIETSASSRFPVKRIKIVLYQSSRLSCKTYNKSKAQHE